MICLYVYNLVVPFRCGCQQQVQRALSGDCMGQRQEHNRSFKNAVLEQLRRQQEEQMLNPYAVSELSISDRTLGRLACELKLRERTGT